MIREPRPGRVVRSALGLLTAVVLAWAGSAGAHSQPYSWLEVRLEPGAAGGSLTAHVVDLAHEVAEPVADSVGTPTGIAARRTRLLAMLDRRLDLEADGSRLRPVWTRVVPVPEKQAVRFEFTLRVGRPSGLQLSGPLFPWDPTHETYFNVWLDGALRHQDLLDRGHRLSRYATGLPARPLAVVVRFAREGIHHIFIGPDHILFIVGLLLLGGGRRRLAKIVTAFTLAHSVTLALATLRIVEPPARLIEPLIALSIVVIGVENLASAGRRDLRAWLAFGFGFVHGFGFASVLRSLELPSGALAPALFAFNLGVEIGQLTIVATVAPFVTALGRRSPAAGARLVAWGSAAVVAAGSFWFVQRVFFAV